LPSPSLHRARLGEKDNLSMAGGKWGKGPKVGWVIGLSKIGRMGQ
jgi:hypothetical protein